MRWAVAEGLISGMTADELQPQGNATRAQVAAILQRYLEKKRTQQGLREISSLVFSLVGLYCK